MKNFTASLIEQAISLHKLGHHPYPFRFYPKSDGKTGKEPCPKYKGWEKTAMNATEAEIRSWDWTGSDKVIGLLLARDRVAVDIDADSVEEMEAASKLVTAHLGNPIAICPSQREHGRHYWYRFKGNPFTCRGWKFGEFRGQKMATVTWHPRCLLEQLKADEGNIIRTTQITSFIKKFPSPLTEKTGKKPDLKAIIEGDRWPRGTINDSLNLACFLAGLKDDKDAHKAAWEKLLRSSDGSEQSLRNHLATRKRAWKRGQQARKEGAAGSEIADLWFHHRKDEWRYLKATGLDQHWIRRHGGQWIPGTTREVYNDIREYVDALGIKNDKVRKRMLNPFFVIGVEKMASQEIIDRKEIDQDPLLLNTPGGVVDLETGKLRDPAPDEIFMKMTECSPDQNSECTLWLECLDQWTEGNRDLQILLQKIAGLALRGDNIEQRFILIQGPGENGKSVFTDILKKAMGDYACTANQTAFKWTRTEQHSVEIKALDGKRLVVVPELGIGYRIDEGKLKAFTGEGEISARGMREKPEPFRPIALPIMTCNHVPKVFDTGKSMQRRTVTIPFRSQLKSVDPNLQHKLQAELPAILQWAVEGHLIYLLEGLHMPEVVQKEHDQFFYDQDAIGRFIDECISVSPNEKISRGDLYGEFQQWMTGQGEQCHETQTAFSGEIGKRLGLRVADVKIKGIRHWKGINIKEELDNTSPSLQG